MADDSFPARPAIAASQLNQLRRLFTALLPANPFYTKKISQAGVPAAVASLREFSEKFPFTTKQEIDEDLRTAAIFIHQHGLRYAELRSIWGKYNTAQPLEKVREAKALRSDR